MPSKQVEDAYDAQKQRESAYSPFPQAQSAISDAPHVHYWVHLREIVTEWGPLVACSIPRVPKRKADVFFCQSCLAQKTVEQT